MALSSMTGFARVEGAAGAWTWAVEARSVNGRNLEVRFRGPPGFETLERATREASQSRFQRGQLTVNVQARRSETAGAVRINRDQVERYLKLCEEYVVAGLATNPNMDGILALRGVLELGDEEDDAAVHAAVESAIAATVAQALDALKAARRQEGSELASILLGLADRIETLKGEAETLAGAQPALIKERFERRMAELLGEAASAERIVQEAAVMAVRGDVREELDRLGSHLAAARALLAQKDASGRRLDFLTQEFMREANTLCSKSASTALTAVGLELKAAIDQLREQVANVE